MLFDLYICFCPSLQSKGITPAQSVYGTLIAGAAKRKQFTYLTQLVKVCINPCFIYV